MMPVFPRICQNFPPLSLLLVFLATFLSVFSTNSRASEEITCQPACLNNGVCRINSSLQTAVCECPDTVDSTYYRGASCQTEAIRCNDTWWCENGGVCAESYDDAGGQTSFSCSCPLAFEGSKCQNPVAACGNGLWCANGGTCERNSYGNGTICMCPSTHTGINCQTLIEPQELGGGTLGTPPVAGLDSQTADNGETGNGDDVVEEDHDKYVRLFYWILGALLITWISALIIVHWSLISRFRKSQGGHMEMDPLPLSNIAPSDKPISLKKNFSLNRNVSLNTRESFRDSRDLEDPDRDPTVPDTPGSCSGNLHDTEAIDISLREISLIVMSPTKEREDSYSREGERDLKASEQLVPTFSSKPFVETEKPG